MKKRAPIILIIVVLTMLCLLLFKDELTAKRNRLAINAMHVSEAPIGLDDPIWQKAQTVQVPVEGRESLNRAKGVVSTRAVYTDGSIYFLFQWNDPTYSIVKQSWLYDGNQWRHMEGNEDRLALLFEITRIDKFSSKGCAVTCHSPADVPKEGWRFATQKAAEKGDLWHWKAARSDPYGHADDAWLTVAGNPSGSYRETGRRKDKGHGGDLKNQTADGTKPRYMHDPSRKPASPGFLLTEETIEIKDHSIFRKGDVIPYRLPIRPSGSRYDVKAKSRYRKGQWTLMLYRKLDTGNEDDVSFNPLKRYSFAMAVFDNSGADHSKATQALVLTFGR